MSIAARDRPKRRRRSRTRCRRRAAIPPSAPKSTPEEKMRGEGPAPAARAAGAARRDAVGRRAAPGRHGDDAEAAGAAAARRIARRGAEEPAEVRAEGILQQPEGPGAGLRPAAVRYQGRRVRSVDSPLRLAGPPQLVRADGGDDDARARGDHVLRASQRRADRRHGGSAVGDRSFNTAAVNALLASNPTTPLPPEYPDDKAFFTVTFYYNESPPGQCRCLVLVPSRRLSSRFSVRPPPARARSGIAIAERFNGEIINCDSTAVYRGFDIGTDKVPLDQRRGIPHHLIDIADPTDEYTAAQFARDAAAVDRRHSCAREAADPGRRHRLLLPRADARTVSRAGEGRRAARAARGDRRAGRASRRCTAW